MSDDLKRHLKRAFMEHTHQGNYHRILPIPKVRIFFFNTWEGELILNFVTKSMDFFQKLPLCEWKTEYYIFGSENLVNRSFVNLEIEKFTLIHLDIFIKEKFEQ